jgi:hypothetical protein
MGKEFTKKKITAYRKFSNQMLEDVTIRQEDGDFERELMTMQLSNFIFTNMVGHKMITKTFERPTFFEWLLRKERTVHIDVIAEEILPNLPNTKNIIYEIKESDL